VTLLNDDRDGDRARAFMTFIHRCPDELIIATDLLVPLHSDFDMSSDGLRSIQSYPCYASQKWIVSSRQASVLPSKFAAVCGERRDKQVGRDNELRNRDTKSKIPGGVMTRVLLVGYDPETVDFSNPALPPGMTIEKIRAGIAATLEQMTDRGWEADVCLIRSDETAGQTVERHLTSAKPESSTASE
jgi:hypothetical protein